MKEIKFRAWAYGWQYPKGRMEYNVAIYSQSDIRIDNGKGDWCKLWDKDTKENKLNELTTEKVMQYIGRKDKNGQEIYEGDIVVYKGHCSRRIIEWNQIKARWGIKKIPHRKIMFWKTEPINTKMPYRKIREHWEVIGNIYENNK